jgi:8-oxo-dGTP pyrophosphatase MutT (NUDIX family)
MHSSAGAVIPAAGGLVWDNSSGQLRLAIIHRSRYDDWTLPKGKLNAGEAWQSAALREVREETGYRVKLLGFAGAVAYQTENGLKVVRFWNMELLERRQQEIDRSEVKEVFWLPPAQACERLVYPVEVAIVESSVEQMNPELTPSSPDA